MTKTYHFMAGLPRSGSTVLSALLNQHPQIYASPQTDLIDLIYNAKSSLIDSETYKAGLLPDSYDCLLNNMANLFYEPIKKPIVIDKNRSWGVPYNFDVIKPYVSADGKIIIVIRPILEILASFLQLARNNHKLFGQNPFINNNLFVSHYRTTDDAVVDTLMIPNGELDKCIYSIYNLLNNHKNDCLVVWFDDLTSKPQATIDKIYEFLQVKKFKNNFKKIEPVDKHDDLAGYRVLGLHDLQSSLVKPTTRPNEILSNYTIQKYKNTLDFLFD